MTASRILLGGAVVLYALFSQPVKAQPVSPGWPSMEVARRSSNPGALGPLTLGMAQADVQTKLGPPASSSRRSAMMMSDEYTYSWDYPAQGVTLYFSAPDESSAGSVLAIKVGPPCDWTAIGGLKVGLNIEQTSKILKSHGGEGVTPIGSVGTDTAGLYFEFFDTALVARLESGKIAGLYLGPNLP